ncbi:MAG TPA: acyl-CoA dehydrogenase family protein [Candidatus Limnocylindrales bacterium]|nr:acyl-CoA dehydrogenase family protein [Candidatus Limnocylindrales bacterium]
MDFDLTPEQQNLKQIAYDFAKKEIAPYVNQYDAEERFPMEIVKKAASLGFTGGVIPEKYGGAGLDYLSFTLIIEEIARVCQTMGAILSLPSGLAGSGILTYGTEEQKQKYLVPLARGECFAGTGVTEPHSGTDVAAMETTVVKKGDRYIINGRKAWISMLNEAAFFLTFATLDKKLKSKGICAFIVEKHWPGVSVKPEKNKVGFRPLSTGQLILEEVEVPAENLVGKEGEGFKVAMCAVENGRLGVAARAVGLTQACLDESVAYAQQRIVFDQPIGRFQLVQSMITDMVVGVESARYLTYRLAHLKDKGHARVRREASIAKMYATDVAMHAAEYAVQIHGAYGCSSEYNVGRYFRDAKFLQIVEGQNQLHRALIAEYALGYRRD